MIESGAPGCHPLNLMRMGRDQSASTDISRRVHTPENWPINRRWAQGALDLLFSVVTLLQSGAVEAWAHVDVVAALCTIFETTKPVLARVFKGQEKHPVKIPVVIDGAAVSVEAGDLEEAEAALMLAKRFHAAHPAVKVTPQSKVRVSSKK